MRRTTGGCTEATGEIDASIDAHQLPVAAERFTGGDNALLR